MKYARVKSLWLRLLLVMNILNILMKNYMYVLMSILYSSLLTHGFFPDTMIVTIIVPIIKNKSGDLLDNNNYKPIARATVASKRFASLIL